MSFLPNTDFKNNFNGSLNSYCISNHYLANYKEECLIN